MNAAAILPGRTEGGRWPRGGRTALDRQPSDGTERRPSEKSAQTNVASTGGWSVWLHRQVSNEPKAPNSLPDISTSFR
jgi:hypothetical protein